MTPPSLMTPPRSARRTCPSRFRAATQARDYLASGKDRENLAVAKLARGQIKEHLALLKDIEFHHDSAVTHDAAAIRSADLP
jgi:hypothetical protein